MPKCIRCGAETSLGSLCEVHSRAIASCDDITAEQIVSRSPDEPALWFIDQWGATHGLAETVSVGRSADCEFAVLHHSVSALHAQIEVSDSAVARVVDRGSLNGTFVNGERVRNGKLFDGDVLRFGDVSFFFSTTPVPTVPSLGGTGRTVPTRADELVFSAKVQAANEELELVQRFGGGIVRGREVELELGRLEFSLLQILTQRRAERRDPSLSFVSSQELSAQLDFQSVDADSDNVRELVRRVRRKLKAAAIPDLIESRQGVGYRLGWPVKSMG